jgi:antitoxin ChpS
MKKDDMHTTNLRKVGGSIMLAVPPALLDILQLRPGAKVGIAVRGGRLVVEPRQRPRYALDQLLAESGSKVRRGDWVRGKRAGRELI